MKDFIKNLYYNTTFGYYVISIPKYFYDFFRNILISDKIDIKRKFKKIFGYKLNLKNPQTFNEKIQWLKLYDRRPEYTMMSDKYEVRKYIEKTIGKEYLIPLLGIWDKVGNIDFEKLPNQFVLKCTHDSGSVIICKDKNTFDFKAAKRKLRYCLARNYYYHWREWSYKNIKPRIIAEKYMLDEKINEIKDYKIMCFNEKPKCSFVVSERFSSDGLKVTFFDMNWKELPFIRHYPKSEKKIEKPHHYDTMIELSKILSKNTIFIRVDFYEIHHKIYFGELTFYPGNGREKFDPPIWDKYLGNWIKLPI